MLGANIVPTDVRLCVATRGIRQFRLFFNDGNTDCIC